MATSNHTQVTVNASEAEMLACLSDMTPADQACILTVGRALRDGRVSLAQLQATRRPADVRALAESLA